MSQDSGSKDPLSPLQGARIMAALEAARSAAARTSNEQRAASTAIRRQQAELEALQESGQKVGARGRDLRNSLQLLRDSVDRAKLTALNAGLEGARLGEPLGKSMIVMADEVRHLLARAFDALDEHTSLMAEVERDRERALVDLTRVSDSIRLATSALARSEEQGQLTGALLAELRTDLGELFGTDPATAHVLAEAAGQVKNVANSLLDLAERAPLGARELRELLAPLLALMPEGEDPAR